MQGYSRANTIFASFEHRPLRKRLEMAAHDLGCAVYWSEHPPDIAAIPWFVAIVDRAILGSDAWSIYEQYHAEIEDQEACILIDNGPESTTALRQAPIESNDNLNEIINTIASLHEIALSEMKTRNSLLG